MKAIAFGMVFGVMSVSVPAYWAQRDDQLSQRDPGTTQSYVTQHDRADHPETRDAQDNRSPNRVAQSQQTPTRRVRSEPSPARGVRERQTPAQGTRSRRPRAQDAPPRRGMRHAPGGYVQFEDIPTEKTEHRIDVGGRKLVCRVYGSGKPTVVLVSGFGAPQEIWNPIVPELAKHTTVVTYDRAGYGKSEVGDRPVDGKETAKDLHALIEALDIPKPVITLGHSYGGKIVRLHASEFPRDIVGLILEDAGHEDMKEVTESLLEGEELKMFRRMAGGRPPEPGIGGAELGSLEQTHQQLRQARKLPQVPFTVMTAGNRPPFAMFSQETAEKLRAAGLEQEKKLTDLIPGGKYVLVEASDHNIHWDKPKAVIDEVLAMLNTVRSGTKPADDS